MKKYHVFFTLNELPKPASADMMHFVNCANAAANLGYPALLVYPQRDMRSLDPRRWLFPVRIEPSSRELRDFYGASEKLRIIRLPCPRFFEAVSRGRVAPAALAKRYFLPGFIFPRAELFHTRDWNLVRCAIEHNVPAVFYHEGGLISEDFCEDYVRSALLKFVVTDCYVQKENMQLRGMPPEKIRVFSNGVNRIFFSRQTERAEVWRKKMMPGGARYMVVYAGSLAPRKGVDILVDAAPRLPEVQFVIAGGSDDEINNWKKSLAEKKIVNVISLGRIQHSDLVSLYQAADIVVYSHRSGEAATHTSPLKFFEYLASGTPIVAADIPFLEEFKDKNLAMEVYAPDNVEGFAVSLRSALGRYPRRSEGYFPNISLARRFTWEERMSKTFKCIEGSTAPEKDQ